MDVNQDLDPSARGTVIDFHLMCGTSFRDMPVNVQPWKSAQLILGGYDKAHLTASYSFDQDTFLSSELHQLPRFH